MRCLAPQESLGPMPLELLANGQQAASQGNGETNFPKGSKRERHQSWAAELCGQQLGPPLCVAQSLVSICRAEETAWPPPHFLRATYRRGNHTSLEVGPLGHMSSGR